MISPGIAQHVRLYALSLRSELPIAGAPRDDGAVDASIRIHQRALAHSTGPESWTAIWTAPEKGPDGTPAFVVEQRCGPAGGWRWRWCDGVSFEIDHGGKHVWVSWPDGESAECAAYYFVGPIMAFLLRLGGSTLLHGSVVANEREAIAILGESGAGKSTLAAALLQRGFRVVTDDLIVLTEAHGELRVAPGYAGLRLWGDSVAQVLGATSDAPPAIPASRYWQGWDKRFLQLDASQWLPSFSPPLRHVYLLGERSNDPPHLQAIAHSQAAWALDQNVYQRFLRSDSQRRTDFAALAQLQRQARVRRLHSSEQLGQLDDFLRLILDDIAHHSS